jgi:hypothetical protein
MQERSAILLAQVPERALADGAQKTVCMEKRIKKDVSYNGSFYVNEKKRFP